MDAVVLATPISILYDAESGEIRRMHQAVAWHAGDLPSDEELAEEARAIEKRTHRGGSPRLETLLVSEGEVRSGIHYAVDPAGQRLVELGPLEPRAGRQ